MKKMDPDLPFWYWTLNDRYREQEADFDEEDGNPLRLRNLHMNAREDAAIFVPGKEYLPARDRPTIRQLVHQFDVGLPPVTHARTRRHKKYAFYNPWLPAVSHI